MLVRSSIIPALLAAVALTGCAAPNEVEPGYVRFTIDMVNTGEHETWVGATIELPRHDHDFWKATYHPCEFDSPKSIKPGQMLTVSCEVPTPKLPFSEQAAAPDDAYASVIVDTYGSPDSNHEIDGNMYYLREKLADQSEWNFHATLESAYVASIERI